MAFEREIAAAKKIGDGWLKHSQQVQAAFTDIKKQNLKWEKDELRKVTDALAKGVPDDPSVVKSLEHELDVIEERLKEFQAHGQKLYDEHEKWSLAEPRKNMGFIAPKLNLGKPGAPAYDAVSLALKRQLTEVATAIAATQNAWNKDLHFSIQTHLASVSAARKVLSREKSAGSAFMQQMTDEAKRFAEYCDGAFNALKVNADVADLEDLKKGTWQQRPQMQKDQKLQQYKKRLETVPQILAQMEKNYQRIMKAVPANHRDGWLASASRKQIEDKKKVTQDKLKAATNLYKKLIPAAEKAGANDH